MDLLAREPELKMVPGFRQAAGAVYSHERQTIF